MSRSSSRSGGRYTFERERQEAAPFPGRVAPARSGALLPDASGFPLFYSVLAGWDCSCWSGTPPPPDFSRATALADAALASARPAWPAAARTRHLPLQAVPRAATAAQRA